MKLSGKTDGLFYATAGSAGFDIPSAENMIIAPGETLVVPTGLYIVPGSAAPNEELQIRPRSGLALSGITVLNSPGTVDGDYPEEIGVIIHNLSPTHDFIIEIGDRIAQGVVATFNRMENVPVKDEKRIGGYGSTGVKGK
ncbi:MAG: dUTP diphosphatase [Chloroflexi bacterium]|nr:MAG: dUTP diphosphatase [Chloroflexota bacterium]